jgi:hypothetical protein
MSGKLAREFEMAFDQTSPGATGKDKFAFTVNGTRYTANDAVLQGRDILQKAGFTPASEHILIQVIRPGTKSVGLDEDVGLAEAGAEEFQAFPSDRAFTFTVDEVGYEWGAASIDEPTLRDISGTPTNKVLILDNKGGPDSALDENSVVDLAARGAEHLRTERRVFHIIVNARPAEVANDEVSYADVVALAFNPVPTGADVIFTITYRKGPKQNPKGTLAEGHSVSIKNGMIFSVTQTNRS